MPRSTEADATARPVGHQQLCVLEDFRFESGESLPRLRVAWVSYGALAPARDNVLLVLPGTSNTCADALGYVGPGRAYDTDRFHVVCVEAIGLGVSSQPAESLHGAFPRYGVRDLVRAQAAMVSKVLELGETPLAAVAGASMGAFQALEWAIHYPEQVRAAVLMMPAVQAGGVMRTVTQQMIDVITLDAAWQGGAYSTQPRDGLRAAGRHYFPWAVTDEYLESRPSADLAQELGSAGCRFAEFDAWNLIRRYEASSRHDVRQPFGGDLAQALACITARMLVLPCKQDRLLGVRTAQLIAQGVQHASYVEVDSIKGHLAWRPQPGSSETEFVTRHVRSFLEH